MMDIDSKGGYYDVKSPKLILHEWLLRDKQPKARYKALPGPSGTWLAKVVLPHPKQSDKDIVVFLPESHAAETEDEAQQLGAVAALHRVAGDRALERTLPPQYAPLWRALSQAAMERKVRDKMVEEKRAAQQAKQQAALKRRGPATVIMAEDKRKLVEDIIAEARGGNGNDSYGNNNISSDDGWESFGRPDAAATGARTVEVPSALADDLMVLGFTSEDAARAVAAVTATSGGAELSNALDWLCLNVSEERLPSNFAPGAAGTPISVLYKAAPKSGKIGNASNSSFSSLTTAAEEGDDARKVNQVDVATALDDPAVKELMQYGYPPRVAADALQQSGGHVQDAVRLLYRKLCNIASDNNENAASSFLEEWNEERVALEAIYGNDVSFPSDTWTTIRCNALLDGQAAQIAAEFCGVSKEELMMDGVGVDLEAWAPPQGSDSSYPTAVPILAVKSGSLQPRTILALTQSLGKAAEEMLGRPMLYELASLMPEALPECLVNPPSLQTLLGESNEENSSTIVSSESDYEDLLAEELDASLNLNASSGGAGDKSRRFKKPSSNSSQRSGRRPQFSAQELAAESSLLLQHQNDLLTSSKHASMRSQRTKLPAFSKRDEVVGAVKAPSARVLVISGATGCGKSTQVPQYILEEAISAGHGASCNIIVTQPRRISALGLASRVSAERGEAVGQTVGYSVRLDSKQSKRTRLLFCTTGILLRRLLSDPSLHGSTHVVLDEVHERSIESDLLLLLLRNLLASGANPRLEVVLMSATADADLFANYFNTVLPQKERSTILTIPGFTHPVTDLFLEDALESTGFIVGKTSKYAKKNAGKKGGNGGEGGDQEEDEAALSEDKSSSSRYSPDTMQSLRNVDESLINYDLIEAVVAHVAAKSMASSNSKGSKGGEANAILVFAPGAEEINRIIRTLQDSPKLAAASPGGVRTLPLHGGLPPSHQSRVFERPPPGVLKVVVSTNVAETSITIDDVVCVIDTGRVKEMRLDSQRGIARLQETFVSQASAKQRRGRAGRVRPGVCYRLFSRTTWNRMPRGTPPEVARAPLQSLVMDIKGILRNVDVGAALADMVTPPDPAAVAQAITSLQRVGALDPGTGDLTPLGSHLTKMPCDPRVGKMLIFGAMLRCLDPLLTVAAAQGHGRPVFFSPPDKREEAEAAKRTLIANVAASKSDHLAAVAAYNGWRAVLAKGGRSAASNFCSRNYVSDQAMEGIHAGRKQYAEILADLGFVSADYPSDCTQHGYNPGTAAPTIGGARGDSGSATTASAPSAIIARHTAPGGVDQFAGHARIVKAVLAAGLYPQLLRVEHPAVKYQKVLGGAVETAGEAHKVRFFDREKGENERNYSFDIKTVFLGSTVYKET